MFKDFFRRTKDPKNTSGSLAARLLARGKAALEDHKELLLDLLDSNASRDLIRNLADRGLAIPQSTLLREGQKIVSTLQGVDAALERLDCATDGIRLKLTVAKKFVKTVIHPHVVIDRLVLNPDRQEAVIRVESVRVEGRNKAGAAAAALANFVLRRASLKIALDRYLPQVEGLRVEQDRVTIDLSRIEAIRKLLRPLPVVDLPTLAFVHVTEARHADSGVLVKGRLTL